MNFGITVVKCVSAAEGKENRDLFWSSRVAYHH